MVGMRWGEERGIAGVGGTDARVFRVEGFAVAEGYGGKKCLSCRGWKKRERGFGQ